MDFKLTAKNIGPLRVFSSSQQIGNCKIGIFANNGSGKTFLSRMFRLAGLNEYEQDQLNNLLTINEKSGQFVFELKNPDEGGRVRKLNVDVTRDAPAPVITNDSGYLFHVFNSDYVRENIEIRKYAPDGNIEGYILGKGNIDLSKEKEELESLHEKQDKLVEELKSIVESEREKLDALGIRKNLGQYKEFNYDNLLSGADPDESLSFFQLTELHNALKAMPDDLPDVIALPTVPALPDFAGISELLQTPYSRSELADEFVTKVKSKQSFIEQGLQFSDQSECPFCEQAYSDQALALIKKYNDYLTDEEAKVVKRCKDKIAELDILQKQYEKCATDVTRSVRDFEKKKKYIPSMKDADLVEPPSGKSIADAVDEICRLLENKAEHIDQTNFEFSNHRTSIESYREEFVRALEVSAKTIDIFNSKKNNAQDEKRELDRRLCRALFLETKSSIADKFSSVSSQALKLDTLRSDIEKREAQVRVEKRERVAGSLTQFLDLFFAGKYQFNRSEFHITFEGEVLGQKISSVLSDGEKSIVAFCHYLAETHLLLTREDDYKKVFFIIDDPISSLDFHYVYAVAQVIRKIGNYFNLEGRPRFMVLTHNIEFMSILMRNKIVLQRFVLAGNQLETLNEHLIMPYEAHLRDVYSVAREKCVPKHTTPNSIRHILETISRFDAPRMTLEDYFEECVELQGNEFVYSLMHDGSHGMIRMDKSYTEEMIRRGCEAVVGFVEKKFKGQIAHMVRN